MSEHNERLLFTLAMCIAVTVLFVMWRKGSDAAEAQRAKEAAVHGPAQAGTQAAKPAAEPLPATQASGGQGGGSSAAAPVVAAASVEERAAAQHLVLENARMRVTVSTLGAGLEEVTLKGEKFLLPSVGGKPREQVQVLHTASTQPSVFASEIRSDAGDLPVVPASAKYAVVSADARRLVLRAEGSGLAVTRTLELDPDSYGIHLTLQVGRETPFAGHVSFYVDGTGTESGGMFGSRNTPAAALCSAGGKSERLDVGKEKSWTGPGAAKFAGIDEQYFLTALDPNSASATCELHAVPTGEGKGALATRLTLPLAVSAGGSFKQTLTGYVGPKSEDVLGAVDPNMTEAVDYGFLAAIAKLLLGVMRFFYRAVPPHNWGVAIILLTVLVRGLTFPLQQKSLKSMQEMQRLQPKLEELKKKYAGDTLRMSTEQQKLFKEHGVNPMGGCLPMLIQMPVWLALYRALQLSVDLYNSVFIRGWLDDLSQKDPYYVLPIAMGATMLLTQILTPAPTSNPSQKSVGYIMSVMMTFIMVNLPSGLALYMFVSNVLTIAQQMYLRKAFPPPPARGQTLIATPQKA